MSDHKIVKFVDMSDDVRDLYARVQDAVNGARDSITDNDVLDALANILVRFAVAAGVNPLDQLVEAVAKRVDFEQNPPPTDGES